LADSEARIEKLEIELVHQQRVTEQLNEVVTEQTKELLRLGRAFDRLSKQIAELRKRPTGAETPPTLEDEKPPHY
jgi:SlyX protein